MGVVTITCPRTGAHVPVGLEITSEGFKALRPRVARMRCPACGNEHAWSKGIAWLAQVPPAAALPPAPMPSPAVSRFEEKLPTPGVRAHIGRVEADHRSRVSRLLATGRIGPSRKREAADPAAAKVDGHEARPPGPAKG